MKSLIAILSAAICLFYCEVDLSAQEKKNDKKWEISGYFGAGGNGRDGPIRPFYFNTYCIGVGLEYYFTPRISVEGEINYLPHTAHALPSFKHFPWDWSDVTFIGEEQKYRLLWGINFLFYFDITRIKKLAMRWFLIVGTGYQYDRAEFTVVSLTTQEQDKYGYGELWFQFPTFGGGLKVNIKGDWSLRFLYKIHRFAVEGLQTNRFGLGLSCRF